MMIASSASNATVVCNNFRTGLMDGGFEDKDMPKRVSTARHATTYTRRRLVSLRHESSTRHILTALHPTRILLAVTVTDTFQANTTQKAVCSSGNCHNDKHLATSGRGRLRLPKTSLPFRTSSPVHKLLQLSAVSTRNGLRLRAQCDGRG